MKILSSFALASLLLLCLGATNADSPSRYRLTILPIDIENPDKLDNVQFSGGIKDSQVIGLATVGTGKLACWQPVVWRPHHPLRILDKPFLNQDPNSNLITFVFPAAINRSGDVVGGDFTSFTGAWSGRDCSAMLWHDGKTITLPGFTGPYATVALGINDIGEIVGYNQYDDVSPSPDNPEPPGGSDHAFLWRKGHVKILWRGIARGINNRSEVIGLRYKYVGYGADGVEKMTGILWQQGHLRLLPFQPMAINDRGWIAGNIPVSDTENRACLWKNGRLRHLSWQPSYANAINARGDVVGDRDDKYSSHPARAVIWHGGHTYDLNHLVGMPANWVLHSAYGINSQGWIIGIGCRYKTAKDKEPIGSYFSFLLTPR